MLTKLQGPALLWAEKKKKKKKQIEGKAVRENLNPLPLGYRSAFLQLAGPRQDPCSGPSVIRLSSEELLLHCVCAFRRVYLKKFNAIKSKRKIISTRLCPFFFNMCTASGNTGISQKSRV